MNSCVNFTLSEYLTDAALSRFTQIPLRDFEAMRDRGGCSEEIGDALLTQAHQMFTWWHRVREGTLKRSTFRSSMTPLRREIERLLEAGSRCGVPKTAGTCRDILKRREALWTFVQVEGVEPTNNMAERAIPPGVLWRKGSGGLTLCRKHDDGGHNLEATAAQRLGVPHCSV